MVSKEEVLLFMKRIGLDEANKGNKDSLLARPKTKTCVKTPHMLCDNCGDCKKNN